MVEGIGGGAPVDPQKPTDTHLKPMPHVPGGIVHPEGQDQFNPGKMPIHNISDIKRMCKLQFGEENGEKMYDKFMKGIANQMLSQVRASQKRVKEAMKEIRRGQ